jgi:hypothetical protein
MGTTALASVYPGTGVCPKDMNFGYLHGTAPAAGQVTFLGGEFVPPIGSRQTLQIGGSFYTGYVVGREYDPIADETVIHLVDWRDKLHDYHMAAAFNMEEDDGRFFHILPYNWQIQRRTYVTRELGQFDFDQFQRLSPRISFRIQIAKNTLYSALTILDWMGSQRGFVVTGDTLALYKLSVSYPLNLDWNSGSTKAIDAIQQIVSKCGCQATFYFANVLYVTIRGFTEDIFSQSLEFLSDPDTFCLFGASSGKIGQELNELGRRVVIVGDRNKHEYVYACRANWNPAWNFAVVSGEVALSALLDRLGLTLLDKVSDLPERFHDNETWNDTDNAGKGALPARKTRNMMTIQDYLNKIAFKVYVADSGYYSPDFTCATVGRPVGKLGFLDAEELAPIADFTFDILDFQNNLFFDDPVGNMHFPPSRTLVTDSNIQYIVYCSSDKIEQAARNPIAFQTYLVPRTRGVSVDTEEVVNPTTGESEYRVRIFFDEIQARLRRGFNQKVLTLGDISPDTVLIRLALDADIYRFTAGEGIGSPRVREQVINVRNLYRAFLNNKEVTVLRENVKAYWDKRIGAQPLDYVPVRADQIGLAIAVQALAHYAISVSGSLHYDDICGSLPDGLIDSVQVAYSGLAGQGITEDVNFTTGFADDKEFRHPFPVKISRRFKDEEELQLDRAREMARLAFKDRQNQAKLGKAIDIGNLVGNGVANIKNLAQAMITYAKDGIAEINFTLEWLTKQEVDVGELIPLNKPGADEVAPPPEEVNPEAPEEE